MAKPKALSAQERRKRKNECEKRRRQKLKQDPTKSSQLKQLKHNIYLKAKKSGKVKMIEKMTPREQRMKRRAWRHNKKKSRIKQKSMNSEACSSLNVSIQKKRGRKIVRRDRASAYKQLNNVKQENALLRRIAEKYKKRYTRLFASNAKMLTPTKTKVKNFLNGRNVPQDVRRQLLFGETLRSELTQKYKSLRKRDKQIFTKVITGRIVKKYRFLTKCKDFLSRKLRYSYGNESILQYERKKNSKCEILKNQVIEFLELDINSTLCPGKKDTIKYKDSKMQKRYLNDTLKNLQIKFNAISNIKLSYSTFCKLRPAWIVNQNVNKRDTCLCIKHENFRMVISKLHFLKIIKEKSPSELLKSVTCEEQTEECYKRKCVKCHDKKITFNESECDENTTFKKWVTVTEKRISSKTKKEITVKITSKQVINCTVGELITVLEKSINIFMIHTLNITHQFEEISNLMKNLKETDLFFHIDFSENYQCKYAKEPQMVHFGASKAQITLHTGMMYTNSFKEAFCTISTSLNHNACAIIAHMVPILEKYLTQFPSAASLHFLSDSTSTQYRNKNIYFMTSHYLLKLFPNINEITWNYSESGHGKGAPDGIGATLKQTADRIVAEGKDMSNCELLIRRLRKRISKVFLAEIPVKSIVEMENILKSSAVEKFCGSMKVHQFALTRNSNVMFRSLSCYKCGAGEKCKHYHVGSLPKNNPVEDEALLSFEIGSWVLVRYDGTDYPGEISAVMKNEIEILTMHPAGDHSKTFKRQYKWPVLEDKHIYPISDVVKTISPPIPCGSRAAFFTFDDIY